MAKEYQRKAAHKMLMKLTIKIIKKNIVQFLYELMKSKTGVLPLLFSFDVKFGLCQSLILEQENVFQPFCCFSSDSCLLQQVIFKIYFNYKFFPLNWKNCRTDKILSLVIANKIPDSQGRIKLKCCYGRAKNLCPL